MDLEKEGSLAIGLHKKISWDTPPLFDHNFLWTNLRKVDLVGHRTYIPSAEVDMISILAHIPFEKLYLDWGEMCYLFQLAKKADIPLVLAEASRHHWDQSLKSLIRVMNRAHEQAFGIPSPFHRHYSKMSSSISTLPYECSMTYAAGSLIEVRAWRKFFEIAFDVHRMGHFFRGRVERKNISVA
jgi:hypothetical protein